MLGKAVRLAIVAGVCMALTASPVAAEIKDANGHQTKLVTGVSTNTVLTVIPVGTLTCEKVHFAAEVFGTAIETTEMSATGCLLNGMSGVTVTGGQTAMEFGGGTGSGSATYIYDVPGAGPCFLETNSLALSYKVNDDVVSVTGSLVNTSGVKCLPSVTLHGSFTLTDTETEEPAKILG